MSADLPIPMRWDGDGFVPLSPKWSAEADRRYVIGEVYRVDIVEDRSDVSHRHEFAWLREAWANLPEELADIYPSPEALRKRALIEAGYFDETIVDAGTNAAAIRVAAAFRAREEFAHVVVRGPLVAIRTAKSQSRRAMGRADFQASKTAIMEIVAQMLGVSATMLRQSRAA
jgi:hypothetical protein